LHPEAIQRIARMDLRAKHIVEGFLSGEHRSPYFGQSIEFVQHREYVPGDDVRRIDWKVWAKQDRYYIKQYEEETNLRATLVVDVSAGMQYGSGPLNKYEYASTIAVSLAYLLLRQQDGVGCISFDDKVRRTVPIRSRMNHLQDVIQCLDASAPQDKTDIAGVLTSVAQETPRRGMICLISDLFCDRAALAKGLRLLRQRGHDVMVFHVMDDDELDFKFNGATRFEALESMDKLNCNPRALRAGYMEALQAYLEEVRRLCANHVCDYALIRTSQPLDAALSAYLSNRLGMHKRN
jgi:uncharacterized protein (DUF58 family)